MKTSIGIGFRRDFANEFLTNQKFTPDFIEFAPENWMNMGGYWKNILDQVAERFPVTCHGLSLSIGSPDELDWSFLKELKQFLKHYQVEIYSEHLSYTKAANAHLYDLLPVPFRLDAINHIVNRIRQVQDYLERPLVLENVSYYTPVAAEMDEITFIDEIVNQSDCHLLLDVNNVYVNAFNHGYDAREFIRQMPLNKVAYIHMAGHEKVAPDLIIDTHGQAIIDPVYELFDYTLSLMQPVPVLLERDFNIPETDALIMEMKQLKTIATKHWEVHHATKH
ncbi:DUF692 domain-containing protein [Marinilabiliaceae bacterium JC017]|nr:DUF692 domain-containing protein [Marinilabiliaceae bacterium JC017]